MKGKKTGGGSRKGVPNKSTAEIKAVAQQYGHKAIKKLAALAGLIEGEMTAQSEQAQVAACRELLDRGYGKSPQGLTLTGEDGGPVQIQQIERVFIHKAQD